MWPFFFELQNVRWPCRPMSHAITIYLCPTSIMLVSFSGFYCSYCSFNLTCSPSLIVTGCLCFSEQCMFNHVCPRWGQNKCRWEWSRVEMKAACQSSLATDRWKTWNGRDTKWKKKKSVSLQIHRQKGFNSTFVIIVFFYIWTLK